MVRREIIGELMCHGELQMASFGARHSLRFSEAFAPEMVRLAQCADDGLVTIDDDAIRVTPRGRLLLRNVAMCFDAYLQQPSEAVRYSRTI
jgi:oxygen-independent coproporphyrinogen-3 oxidase